MLATDKERNDLICADVMSVLEEKRFPIVLTERRDHLEALAQGLQKNVPHAIILHGTMKASARRKAIDSLAALSEGVPRLILATGRYVGEGFDVAGLDTLFLALPVSWKGTLIQYAGRLHRPYAGKTEVRIYDYFDREVSMLRCMFEKRLRGYRAMRYVQRLS